MNDNYESVTLDEWISIHSTEDEMRSVFLNLDRALKYIHEHGYCIETFYPSMIEVLNGSPKQIQFKKLMELPKDLIQKKKFVQEDIFNSSFIQIGICSNSLSSLKPEFLKSNFDSFSQFIPTDMIPYYRGVVQRGASIYLCDYLAEKKKRDVEQLGDEMSSSEKGGNSLVKSNGHNIYIEPVTNNRINAQIYKQINDYKDSAFIRIMVVPTIVLLSVLFLTLIVFVLSCFH